MYLKYGDYQHASDDATPFITREGVYSDAGILWAIRERWQIEGMAFGSSVSALTTTPSQIEAAYLQNGKDLALYENDGTQTIHRLINADCYGGTKVVGGVSYQNNSVLKNAEYVTYRTYTVVVEGLLPISAGTGLIEFGETIQFSGGGPVWCYLPVITGVPQQQLLRQQSPVRAVQSGRMLRTLLPWPTPPNPIWPAAEHRELRQVEHRSPRRMGKHGTIYYTQYETLWTYHFEAMTLVGLPNIWG